MAKLEGRARLNSCRVQMDKAQVLANFTAMFGTAAALYRAPGRVNLIGEHTDYNGGFVLPAAIDLACWAAVAPRDDTNLRIYSAHFDESVECDLGDAHLQPSGKWSDYPVGVAWALQHAGHRLRGANLYIRGDVPLGAGLSSSAAIEVCVGYALLDLSGHVVDRTRLALSCQKAENEFVGARCGIMDQFISCHGQARHAVLLDCRSLDYHLVPLPDEIQLVVCNTMVKHSLAASEYNTRRSQCEEGVRRLTEVLPHISSLRDVTLPELEQHRGRLPDTIYKRCRHVVTENDRVRKLASALHDGRVGELNPLMADSHRSMRDDYQISCPELDLMVDLACQQKGVFGARMTGGGFGGCTINLVNAADSLEFQRRVAAEYRSATGLNPDIYVCKASLGAGPADAQAENDMIQSPHRSAQGHG
jgi:galactokinase